MRSGHTTWLAVAVAGLAALGCSDSGGDDAGGGGAAGDQAISPGSMQAGRGGAGAGTGRGAPGSAAGGGGTGGAAGAGSGGAGGGGPQGPVLEPGEPGDADVQLQVRADQDVRPISPLVYGHNGSERLSDNRYGLLRSGGNRLTAYNWETNASNAGSDWMFQNDGLLSDGDQPALAVTPMIDEARAAGAEALVTVPIVDYVAADKNGDGDVRGSGADYLSLRFERNVAAKGGAFADPPDATDDAVYQDELVAFLKTRYPDGGVLFSLDNEPDLWSSTHAEVHPGPVTYAELWERNQRFASAIKAVWPEAEVTGFVSYGFNGYVSLQNASDAAGRDFVEWYLDQARQAEADAGQRLIDYLDLHWYPEAQGGGERIVAEGSSDGLVEAREQAPRSLWDASYEESSWIRDFVGGPIDLLHRLQAKIDAHYPGTKLAFTEWNYGGGGHVSGAIATADVLGTFGRLGVGAACEWPLAEDESFIEAAFRAYRNFDGRGGQFGDTSVQASSSDVERVTVYGSIDGSDADAAVVIAINKARTPLRVGLQLAHATSFAAADVYQLTSSAAALSEAPSVAAVAQNAFNLELPAQSVSVIVPKR